MIFEDGRPGATVETAIVSYDGGAVQRRYDRLATEEPLEIRLRAGGQTQTVAITMRTPDADFELAAGFLFDEGAIAGLDEVAGITYCIDRDDRRRAALQHRQRRPARRDAAAARARSNATSR